MRGFVDLHSLTEDERIQVIGKAVAETNRGIVGVMLEKDEPEKIERYIRKVAERFPDVVVQERIDGPTPLVVTIKFGRKH